MNKTNYYNSSDMIQSLENKSRKGEQHVLDLMDNKDFSSLQVGKISDGAEQHVM